MLVELVTLEDDSIANDASVIAPLYLKSRTPAFKLTALEPKAFALAATRVPALIVVDPL